MTPAEHEQARQVAERAVGLNRKVAFPLSAEQADVLARCYLERVPVSPPLAEPVTLGARSPLAFQLGPYANEPEIQRGTFTGEVTIWPADGLEQHVHLHVVDEDGEPLVVHPWEARPPADGGADHGGTTAE